MARPAGSMVVSEPDTGAGDPQQLARVSVQCRAEVLRPDSREHLTAKSLYLERLPEAAQLFEFPDFVLFRLIPNRARFVGGFARARTLDRHDLLQAAALG